MKYKIIMTKGVYITENFEKVKEISMWHSKGSYGKKPHFVAIQGVAIINPTYVIAIEKINEKMP